jgi:molybdopterin-guanine dinucleotide biosynthesis protein A
LTQRPNIILLGATGRNVGKTEFACRLIHRLAGQGVVAAKITVIRELDHCPRGGDGCGVCGTHGASFSITEELCASDDKDTQRMKSAGAARVYWLRSRQSCLAEAMAQLLACLPDNFPVILESNSARQVLEPGLFLVISEGHAMNIKPSCQAVLHHADTIANFDGQGWDIDPAQIQFAVGRWSFPQDAAAIVLAGGQSRRMGRDKSLLDLGGKPMVQHIVDQLRPLFPRILIGANDAAKYRFLNLPVIPDRAPDCGPLMAILSTLAASPAELNFVVGCDIPNLHRPFIRQMIALAQDCDIVMPVTADGRHEPLYAVYRRSVIPAAEEILNCGGRRIVELLDRARVRLVPLPTGDWYRNLNTPQDYQEAVQHAGGSRT